MNTLQYLMGLLPVIGRDVILENLRIVNGAYAKASQDLSGLGELFRNHKFNDDYAKSYSAAYMTSMKEKGNAKNVITHFISSLPNVMANISLLEDMVNGNIEESVATKRTTFKNATIMRLTDAVDFALSYGINLVNYLTILETNAASAKLEGFEPRYIPEPVAEMIRNDMAAFLTVMNIFSMPVNDVQERLDSIPEVIVDDTNYGALASTMGRGKLDPLNMDGVKGFSGSPFLAIGRWRAERQDAAYRLAEETIQVLKLRKLQLERALAGKQDASLIRQINALQSRIDELNRKIEEYAKKR